MTSLREKIQDLFKPVEPLPHGVYTYQSPPEDPNNFRLHLRIDPNGQAVLIVNASTVLHLNATAAEYAYYMVKEMPVEEITPLITKRYRVSADQARQDYLDFRDRLDTLINTPDLDPVTYLDFDRQTPFSGEIQAPYRLDCALTYRLGEEIDPAYAPAARVTRELESEEWEQILEKAWQAGIPHVIFTGGEPTLREDLARLILYAEHNGQVTGLITDGLKLADSAYLDSLLLTGLDHLLFVYHPERPESLPALHNCLEADLSVAVHLSLTPGNQSLLENLLEQFAEMGVKAVSLSTSEPNLDAGLQKLRDKVAALDLELVWNIPVPYSALNPVTMEITSTREPDQVQNPAGRAFLYIEPDGDVLPAQGVDRLLGNLVRDSWEQVWKA